MEMIEYCINMLKSLEKLYNLSNDEKSKIISRELYYNYFKELVNIQNESLDYYNKLLDSINLPPEDKRELLLSVNKDQKYLDTSNKDVIEENKKRIDKLQEDLKNPNELLIKTWIDNYYEFVNQYKECFIIDDLIGYLKNIFNGKFNNLLDQFIISLDSIKDNSMYKVKNIKSSDINLASIYDNQLKSLLKEYDLNSVSLEEFNSKIKSKLLRVNINNNGNIDVNYKKNRYLSMILKIRNKLGNKNFDENEMNKKELGNF